MRLDDGKGKVLAADAPDDLKRRNEKLAKINAVLMQRVERSMDYQANAYSLFQTAIGLEGQVKVRTEELKTALNRLERANDELVQARDAAERANRFKTRFFTAVGHDLLQPLHAARLSISAMAEGGGSVQHTRLIRQVDHALSTIEELLGTILDLSKLEVGTIKPIMHTVALGDLFHSLVVDLGPIAQNKSLMLTLRETDALVTSDPLMLRRILQNLLANAVQYTDHGRILLAARRRGDLVRIDVWDTGPGIPLSERGKIFEEFQRGSAAERSRGGGFGIGLSIIGRMADALGHKVELCSRPGKGTRFSVYAPYAGRTTQLSLRSDKNAAAARQAYGLAATRALVIDNDGAVLEAMRQLLDRWGCEGRFAVSISGVEALLDREPEFRPDIILADYHLDFGESGLRAVERLRDAWKSSIPAIVITADHASDVANKVQAAGCEILLKPAKPAELRALIVNLLS
jgi:two-component system, sensor histidine kinase